MPDYIEKFNDDYDLDLKSSAGPSNTDPEGGRTPTLVSGSWTESDGRHYATTASGSSPAINSIYRLDDRQDFFRALFHLLHYLHYLTHHTAASDSYVFNDVFHDNFAFFTSFDITAASGSTVTIDTSSSDPLSVGVARSGAFTDPDSGDYSITYTTTNHPFPAPGDMVDFTGNSVLAGKIKAKIKSISVGASTTTLALDQPVSQAFTKADSAGATPTCKIYRNAVKRPEKWPALQPNERLYGKDTYIESAVSTPNDVITLQVASADIGIAYPYTSDSGFRDTIKIETSEDGGSTWTDATDTLGDTDHLVCTHTGASGLQTTLDLNGDVSGDVDRVRVRAVVIESDLTADGVHSPCQKRCNHCLLDPTDTVGNYSTNGVDIDGSGRHWFCNQRKRATDPPAKSNLDDFRGGACYQWDCPAFEPAVQGREFTHAMALMISGIGESLTQVAAGNNDVTNFLHDMVDAPGLLYQMNSQDFYGTTNYGTNHPGRFFNSGGYVYLAGTTTDVDGNVTLDIVRGAFYNTSADHTAMNWSSNRWPSDAPGILERRLGTNETPDSQLTITADQDADDYDASHLERSIALLRNIPPSFRHLTSYSGALSFASRSITGLEGEQRIQRPNAATRRTTGIINTAQSPSPPDTTLQHYVIESSTIGGKDVAAYVQHRRTGVSDFGYKRIGGIGINGSIYRANDDGATDGVKRFSIHCSPGFWTSHNQVSQSDDILPYWGSGNVVQYPWPYDQSASPYNNIHNRSIHGNRHKACAGDTIVIPSLGENGVFYIEKAEPGVGDSFANLTFNNFTDYGLVGSFFDFASDMPTGLEDIIITDLEYNITLSAVSGWTYHTGSGTPAVNGVPYDYRPLNNTLDTSDISNMYMEQDRVAGIGSMSAYPSYPTFSQLWTTNGIYRTATGLPNLRAAYTVDGTPAGSKKELVLELPHLHLTYEPDLTASSPFGTVYAVDPRFGTEPVELTWAGYASPYNWTLHTNIYEFRYAGPGNTLIFHPNMAGAYIYVVNYPTVATVDAGELPIGVALNRVTDGSDNKNTAYFKKMDVLQIRDEMGILETLGESALAGLDFYISTSGVIVPPEHASDASYYCRTQSAGAGTWDANLTPDDHYYFHYALGRVYLTQEGIEQLPELMLFQTYARFMNSRQEVSVELLRGLIRAIDCLDTVEITLLGAALPSIAVSAGADLGYPTENSNANGTWLSGDPIIGMANAEITTVLGAGGEMCKDSPGTGYGSLVVDDYAYFTSYTATSTIYVGTDIEQEGDGASAGIKSPIWGLGLDEILKKLPPDSDIIDAKIEITLDEDAYVDEKLTYIVTANKPSGQGIYDVDHLGFAEWESGDGGHTYSITPNATYGDATNQQTTRTTVDMSIGLMLMGKSFDGVWQMINDFSVGSATAGKTSVVDISSVIESLLAAKDSTYVSFGVALSSASGGGLSNNFDPNGHAYKDIARGIMESIGWSIEHTDTGTPDAEGGTSLAHYVKVTTGALSAETVGFGSGILQFKLPDGVVKEMRLIQGGNLPDMDPVT